MQRCSFEEAVALIIREDSRYEPAAYYFLREALDFTIRQLEKPRHVTGQELLDGIRRFALQEYGPMAYSVLRSWGLQRTEDAGNLVFHLVTKGALGKTDEDKIEDFTSVYDFHDAFVKPFLPLSSAEPLAIPRGRAPGGASLLSPHPPPSGSAGI